MISKWLNSIHTHEVFSVISCKDETVFTFRGDGDGDGDFEAISDSATTETLIEYIKHCEQQIKLAQQYLETK